MLWYYSSQHHRTELPCEPNLQVVSQSCFRSDSISPGIQNHKPPCFSEIWLFKTIFLQGTSNRGTFPLDFKILLSNSVSSQCFISPVYMTNKQLDLIILLLLVLVISNLRPGNSLLFPSSVYLNMILIQVSTSNYFWFTFKQQGLFQILKTQRIFSIVFLAFSIYFPS